MGGLRKLPGEAAHFGHGVGHGYWTGSGGCVVAGQSLPCFGYGVVAEAAGWMRTVRVA
jgi:hypothetical protein